VNTMTLGPAGILHLAAACWVLLAGAIQLTRAKGTASHRALGWSWMAALTLVSISSFWLHSHLDVWFGFSLIHLLSIWVLFCVCASIYNVRRGNIRGHRGFAVGAYIGSIVAGTLAVAGQGRFLHDWLFGA
jgi:uncharacterized membrane protein